MSRQIIFFPLFLALTLSSAFSQDNCQKIILDLLSKIETHYEDHSNKMVPTMLKMKGIFSDQEVSNYTQPSPSNKTLTDYAYEMCEKVTEGESHCYLYYEHRLFGDVGFYQKATDLTNELRNTLEGFGIMKSKERIPLDIEVKHYLRKASSAEFRQVDFLIYFFVKEKKHRKLKRLLEKISNSNRQFVNRYLDQAISQNNVEAFMILILDIKDLSRINLNTSEEKILNFFLQNRDLIAILEDMNLTDTPLSLAIQGQHLKGVQEVIHSGAWVNKVTKENKTALDIAEEILSKSNQTEIPRMGWPKEMIQALRVRDFIESIGGRTQEELQELKSKLYTKAFQ